MSEEHATPPLHALFRLIATIPTAVAANLTPRELPHVVQSAGKVVRVLDRDPEVFPVGVVPFGEPARVGKVSSLPEDSDRRLEIERRDVFVAIGSGRVDEARDGFVVFEFRVAVEQQSRDVAVGETFRVQFLQVRRQVRESLCVEELGARYLSACGV